jgi:hypothetical protein
MAGLSIAGDAAGKITKRYRHGANDAAPVVPPFKP